MADTRSDDGAQPLPLARTLTPAERERVVERLSEAFAHDVVALDEFERRVALAYRASSPGELRALVADLAPDAGAAVGAGAAAPGGGPLAVQRIGAVMTNVERAGPPVIPARLEIRAVMANVALDLSRARLAARVTEIDVRCVLGNVELRLPAGVDLENEGGGFLGSFECHDDRDPAASGAPVVRVIGRATLGSVSVRVAR